MDRIDALDDFNAISREVGRFFVDHDLLLMPTLARLPLRLGEPDHNRPGITGWAWTGPGCRSAASSSAG